MSAPKKTTNRWLMTFIVLAVAACTYSPPSTEETSEESSGAGGMTGASSSSTGGGNNTTSSSSGTTTTSSSSSSSSSSGNATSSSSSSSSSSTGGSSSSSSSSSSGQQQTSIVHCGDNAMCKANIMTNMGCCLTGMGFSCGDISGCSLWKFFCDGPEDCGPDETCCFASNTAKCIAGTCNGETLCHDSSECVGGQKMCDTGKYNTIGGCLP